MQVHHSHTMSIGPGDRYWFHIINGWVTLGPWFDKLATVLAKYSPEIWAIVFLLLWFWPPMTQNRARRAVVYAVVSGAISVVLAMLISHTFYQPRPFVVEPQTVHQLISHPADSGFPSDHTAGSFGFAVGLLFAGISDGLWGLVFAAAVALSRVVVGVHWPSDIVVGALLGIVVALIVLGARGALEWLVQLLFRMFRIRPAHRRYSRMR